MRSMNSCLFLSQVQHNTNLLKYHESFLLPVTRKTSCTLLALCLPIVDSIDLRRVRVSAGASLLLSSSSSISSASSSDGKVNLSEKRRQCSKRDVIE